MALIKNHMRMQLYMMHLCGQPMNILVDINLHGALTSITNDKGNRRLPC